jgi:hypothetical protein
LCLLLVEYNIVSDFQAQRLFGAILKRCPELDCFTVQVKGALRVDTVFVGDFVLLVVHQI